jgi:4-carboxymuconolactone decarboxylase
LSRLTNPTRDQFDAAGQQIWDTLAGPRHGMHGPYLMLMHVPQLAGAVAQLGEYLRFHGRLPGMMRECAILCTSRFLDVPFEWVMHEPVALKEGVLKETIEIIRTRKFEQLTGSESSIATIAAEICRSRKLSDDVFAAGLKEFGEETLVELITLVSFYCMIGGIINCFQVSLPDGTPNPFDDVVCK